VPLILNKSSRGTKRRAWNLLTPQRDPSRLPQGFCYKKKAFRTKIHPALAHVNPHRP
jgi:hypothetical protein